MLERRRTLLLAAPLLLVLVAPACSRASRGTSGTDRAEEACRLVADLDATVASVEDADVSDPAAFERTLDEAVARYVGTVERLTALVPETLRPDLERHAAAVQQYRFADAASTRGPLDEYAAITCGPPATTTTLVP